MSVFTKQRPNLWVTTVYTQKTRRQLQMPQSTYIYLSIKIEGRLVSSQALFIIICLQCTLLPIWPTQFSINCIPTAFVFKEFTPILFVHCVLLEKKPVWKLVCSLVHVWVHYLMPKIRADRPCKKAIWTSPLIKTFIEVYFFRLAPCKKVSTKRSGSKVGALHSLSAIAVQRTFHLFNFFSSLTRLPS